MVAKMNWLMDKVTGQDLPPDVILRNFCVYDEVHGLDRWIDMWVYDVCTQFVWVLVHPILFKWGVISLINQLGFVV